MKVCSKTDIGLVRQSNQDACNGGLFQDGSAWAVVCDGMGGAKGGNIASSMAVEQISAQMLSAYRPGMDGNSIKYLMTAAIFHANAVVYDMAKEHEDLRGMGTTVVAAVVANGTVHVAHAGDSRAYLISENGMKQLTTDHSMVQELVNNGDLTEQEARRHPQKNIITRALGVQPSIEVDYGEFAFSERSALLLCTDGLTNYADEGQICTLFKTMECKELAEKLVALAIEGGGGDNITVAIVGN